MPSKTDRRGGRERERERRREERGRGWTQRCGGGSPLPCLWVGLTNNPAKEGRREGERERGGGRKEGGGGLRDVEEAPLCRVYGWDGPTTQPKKGGGRETAKWSGCCKVETVITLLEG